MSWPLVTIKSVATVTTGKTPSTKVEEYFGGSIPFITPAELGVTATVLSSKQTLTEAGAAKIKLVPKNSVLVCCIGSLGKLAIADRELGTNQQINSVTFDESKVYPKYGYYALSLLKPILESMAPATTVAIVNKSKFESLNIPLPPLEQQKRIAAILDKADAIRQKRQKAIELADEFLRSVFLNMFGDPVTNPKGWKTKALSDVFQLSSGNGLTSKQMNNEGMFKVYGGNGITGRHDEYMFEEPKLTIGRVGVYCGCIHITEPKSWITDNALYVKKYLSEVNVHYLAQLLKMSNLNQYAGVAAQPLISGGAYIL